jgi:hypothetical protein
MKRIQRAYVSVSFYEQHGQGGRISRGVVVTAALHQPHSGVHQGPQAQDVYSKNKLK